MRYSEVVGAGFYRIGLNEVAQELVDIHFSGSCHHYYRAIEALSAGLDEQHLWHRTRYLAHLYHLLNTVHECGDFMNAVDDSGRNMDFRESWNPKSFTGLPDPEMFHGLCADPKYPLGSPHAILDSHLSHLNRPEIAQGVGLSKANFRVGAA